MPARSFEVRRAWKYSGRHRVLPIDPDWLGGAEYVVLEKLEDGAILLRPARDVRSESEAARLENQLNAEVVMCDG
jgi:hypothetical protein